MWRVDVSFSRHAVGVRPVATVKAREKYSSVEKPDSDATSLIGNTVVASCCLASVIRDSIMIF